jgi:hypothetical protein
LTRRATRCKPAARPRSGSVIGRPQHRSSNQFGGDRYKRAIHRDVGSPGDIVPRPVGDFLDFAALAGHLDVFYCLLTSSPRELFPQLRKALPNKTRRRGKGIKLSVPLARESLLFAGRLRWSRRASPFQGGGPKVRIPVPFRAESETNPGPDCLARARKPRNLRHRNYDAAHLLREQIKRVEDGLDPMNVMRSPTRRSRPTRGTLSCRPVEMHLEKHATVVGMLWIG